MAALGTTAALPPDVSPGFAVVCSFLERYGSVLDLPELSFPQLERFLQETSAGELCDRLGLCLSGQAPHLTHQGFDHLKFGLLAPRSLCLDGNRLPRCFSEVAKCF